jgi:hypothetical protein
MAGQYGADNFFVTANDGSQVAAKYLKDANGQYVIDLLTERPYIVPADYDPAAVIARFSKIKAKLKGPGSNFPARKAFIIPIRLD